MPHTEATHIGRRRHVHSVTSKLRHSATVVQLLSYVGRT